MALAFWSKFLQPFRLFPLRSTVDRTPVVSLGLSKGSELTREQLVPNRPLFALICSAAALGGKRCLILETPALFFGSSYTALLIEYGTYQTVKARLWPWRPG